MTINNLPPPVKAKPQRKAVVKKTPPARAIKPVKVDPIPPTLKVLHDKLIETQNYIIDLMPIIDRNKQSVLKRVGRDMKRLAIIISKRL